MFKNSFEAQDVIGGQYLVQIPAAGIEAGHLWRAGEAEGLIFFNGVMGFAWPAPWWLGSGRKWAVVARWANMSTAFSPFCPAPVNRITISKLAVGVVLSIFPPYIVLYGKVQRYVDYRLVECK
jgi:hypothetical protein